MGKLNHLGALVLIGLVFRIAFFPPVKGYDLGAVSIAALLALALLLYRPQAPAGHTCKICGTALERWQKRCSFCGADNSSNVCPKCGRSIFDHGLRAEPYPNPCKYLED